MSKDLHHEMREKFIRLSYTNSFYQTTDDYFESDEELEAFLDYRMEHNNEGKIIGIHEKKEVDFIPKGYKKPKF